MHARGAVLPSGEIFVTTQPLLLSGVDVFYGMQKFTVGQDFTPTPITPCKKLTRQPFGENCSLAVCDCTPLYHKATGKILLLGHTAVYGENGKLLPRYARQTGYAVYDEQEGDFGELALLDMGSEEYYSAGNGSGQALELANGDLLIPFSFQSKADMFGGKYNASAAVMRCAFDGKKLTVLEVGSPLVLEIPRGYDEPSIVSHGGEYFLCLRNDLDGYLTKSKDGLHYRQPVPLCFDDGASVGNYCTQQHFISGGGKLYLVYTRKAENNSHVFRHRAPLFMAEVDTVNLRLLRSTEKIVVPERGARLGNFGCCSYSNDRAIVVAAEWMQYGGGDNESWKNCQKYGSDNSIFFSEIVFD